MKDVKEGQPIPVTRSELFHHWQQRLNGCNLTEMKVSYKDADYFQQSDPDLDPDTPIYELIMKESTPEEGHLTWGHVTVFPGKVKDEYFATRGSYHKNHNSEEYFLCMQGEGLIMFLNRQGDCWCEIMEEGSLHHVPADVARRFINLSDTPLMISLCRPANAGIDYDSVSEHPFPCHVYDDDGEMAIRVDLTHEKPDETTEEEAFNEIEALLKM